MKNFKKAFSLIELSIVLLIIGILIAGVTQSSRLIRQMKLASARSLTEGSPVASIKGLVLWLETTGEKAFSQELEDATILPEGVKWLDRNPQSSFKADAATPVTATAPTYVDSCINDLPCLSFTSANSTLMNVNQGLGVPEGVSVFIIIKTVADLPTTKAVILNTNNTDGAGNGWFQISTYNSGEFSHASYDLSGTAFPSDIGTVARNTSYILEVIQNISSNLILGINVNGAMSEASTQDFIERPNLNNGFNIGYHNSDNYLDGYISEIIVFDRAIKSEERVSVQRYLAKKWGIKI